VTANGLQWKFAVELKQPKHVMLSHLVHWSVVVTSGQ